MKTKFFVALLLAQTMGIYGAFAQTNTGQYQVEGTIKNMDLKKVYLRGVKDGEMYYDSAEVKNGAYHFSGPADCFTQVDILGAIPHSQPGISKAPDGVNFITDEGVIKIYSDGTFKNSKFSGQGAQATIDYTTALQPAMDTAKDRIARDPEPDKTKAAYKVLTMTDALLVMMYDCVNFAKVHPQSPAAPFLLSNAAGSKDIPVALVDSILNMLPADKQAITRAKIAPVLAERKKKAAAGDKIAVGSMAPDFTQDDAHNKPVSLSSFKGKYVLVDFWASWCGPCRGENPNVVEAYRQFKDKGFTVLGVSLDGTGSSQAWLDAIKKDGLNWTQVSDLKGWKNEVAVAYGVTSIPQNYLIGPDGKVIAKNLRGEALLKTLGSVLK